MKRNSTQGRLHDAYLVPRVVVTVLVVAGAMPKYELQKEVAGLPRSLMHFKTPVTTLQSTRRFLR